MFLIIDEPRIIWHVIAASTYVCLPRFSDWNYWKFCLRCEKVDTQCGCIITFEVLIVLNLRCYSVEIVGYIKGIWLCPVKIC